MDMCGLNQIFSVVSLAAKRLQGVHGSEVYPTMPDIIIRLKEPPRNCQTCPITIGTRGGLNCPVASKLCGYSCMVPRGYISGRPSYCPLHELPPHGDLIDRAALMEEHAKAESAKYGNLFVAGDNRFIHRFLDAPAIVPAEEGSP